MVNSNLYNRPDDTDMDIPRVPDADHRFSRQRVKQELIAETISRHDNRRHDHPRRRISCLIDSLLSIHIQTDDAEAAEGKSASWHVCLRGAECVYSRWPSGYGQQYEPGVPAGLHGRRPFGCGCHSHRGEFHCVVALGVCSFMQIRIF